MYLSKVVKIMKYQIVCPVNIEWKVFEIYLRTLSYHFRIIGKPPYRHQANHYHKNFY